MCVYGCADAGHVSLLEACRREGTYTVVGLHSDAVVHAHKSLTGGGSLGEPVMNLFERALTLLSCRVSPPIHPSFGTPSMRPCPS